MDATSTSPDVPSSPTREQKKAANERRTAELRAKLIEKQKAALALSQMSRAAAAPTTLERQAGLAVQHASPAPAAPLESLLTTTGIERRDSKQELASDDLFSPQRMQAAGKALAQASLKKQDPTLQLTTTAPANAAAMATRASSNAEWASHLGFTPDDFLNMTFDQLLNRMAEAYAAVPTSNPTRPYYGDLKAWLELTGYHNVEERKAKVASYLERRELEQQAAHLQARIQKLQQEEGGGMPGLRTTGPPPPVSTVTRAPRPAPSLTPSTPFASGIKRPRPPSPTRSVKAPRPNNNYNTPTARRAATSSNQSERGRRIQSPPRFGGPLERRISYPDRRSRSPDRRNRNDKGNENQRRGRDLSLERRQRNYGPPNNPHRQYDAYQPQYDDRDNEALKWTPGGANFEFRNQQQQGRDWDDPGLFSNRSQRFH